MERLRHEKERAEAEFDKLRSAADALDAQLQQLYRNHEQLKKTCAALKADKLGLKKLALEAKAPEVVVQSSGCGKTVFSAVMGAFIGAAVAAATA